MKHLFLVTFALIALSPSIQASDATSPDDLYDLSLGELVHINVVSASLEEEPLRETPVPVTVITQTMIHDSGARHLKDLLTLYVPGFTAVEDQNELNVAARGVFTSSQQKILVMVDGHRLNSRSYSMASPDYGIALHKIQQIEILRGPASSLYGNVSLTAAVNIVLKKGADILGGEASIGVGDHGQQLLQGLYGSQLADRWDVLLWGQFYEADGQSIDIAAVDIYSAAPPVDGGSAILDGFTDKPSYDVGAKLGDEHLGLLVNWRRGHYIEPFTGGGLTGEVYDFSEYDPVHGYGPGLAFETQHYNLSGNLDLSSMTVHGELYGDHNEIHTPLVAVPASGVYVAPGWSENAAGLLSHVSAPMGRHSVIAGVQFDYFTVTESHMLVGSGGVITTPEPATPVLAEGHESVSSLFFQVKYRLPGSWLANVGARYDRKDRYRSEAISDFSPRLAFIYLPNDSFSLKISYASSFVDATYWNRFSSLASYRGADGLDPEKLRAVQITPTLTLLGGGLQYTANLYYSRLDDFIFRDNGAGADQPNYSNAGELTSWGLEQEVAYLTSNLSARGVVSVQRALNSENYGESGGHIHNVPSVTANLILDRHWDRGLRSHLSLRYIGSQRSPIFLQSNGTPVSDPYPTQGVLFQDPDNEVDAAIVTTLGVAWEGGLHRDLDLSLTIHNLFDSSFSQGGSTVHPYPQPGRSLRTSLTWRF